MTQLFEQFKSTGFMITSAITELLQNSWIILALSVCALLISALFLLRSRSELAGRVKEINTLQRDIRAITAAAIGVGERVLELERRQKRLTERQDNMDIYDPANQPYEQAIRMVQTGSDVTELVDVCGLSESEAELITLMHRLDKTA